MKILNKLRDLINKNKEPMIKSLKFTILTVTMTSGFWVIFAFAWCALGGPLTNWALWLLFCLAGIVMVLYMKWLDK
jgi:hypothetical protein